jgi:tetratricopeptide (TPR) repeat protein
MSKNIEKANELLLKHKYKQAFEIFKKEEKSGVDSPFSSLGLAECYYFLKKYNLAYKYAVEVIEKKPDLLRPHIILSYVYARNKEIKKGMSEIQVVLKKDPFMVDALIQFSTLLIEQKNIEEAQKVINQVIALGGGDWITHYNLGYIHHIKKDYKRSIAEYISSFRLKPSFNQPLRITDIFLEQYGNLVSILSLLFLFIVVRFFHIYWAPLVLCGIGILIFLLHVIVDHNRRYILVTILLSIVSIIYAIIVYLL